jgi:hypothetical protein
MLTTTWELRYHARFNANLHERLCTRYHRLNLAASVISAIAASTALAATFQSGSLAPVWQVVLALAAVCAALSPVLRWSDLNAQHSSLAMGYRQLEWRIGQMTVEQGNEELSKLASMESHPVPLGWGRLKLSVEKQTKLEFQVS